MAESGKGRVARLENVASSSLARHSVVSVAAWSARAKPLTEQQYREEDTERMLALGPSTVMCGVLWR